MTTQTASSSSSSSKPAEWKFDVFLSFICDTSNSFADHLDTALKEKGISTFREDEDIETGLEIRAEILTAMEKSRMSVVVLSKDYASSDWCLEELEKILECRKVRGQRVWPIFYHVDANALSEEGFKNNKEMAERWSAALRQLADLRVEHLTADRSEAKFIQDFVDNIFFKLDDTISIVSNGLVGIESRVAEMISYLDLGSNDVRFVGILGMSGIGKTTLAQIVFEKIRLGFEASSFLSIKAHGLVALQEKLLFDILKWKSGGIKWDVNKENGVTRKRLRNKKVLIVLDDVDEDTQLETLAGNHDWFGPGSRIIVTTKDKQLLARNEVPDVCMAKKLINEEALKLFCLKAFNQPCPEVTYEDLSNDFVNYAKGLPLALEVLGKSLVGKEKRIWESKLDKLKAIPDRNVQDILKLGFDALGDTEKILFLDIACIFKGEDKDRVEDILDSCCYYNDDLELLIDKSLITISENRLWMHDLLQEMGRRIACQGSREDWSRLWHCKDDTDLLKEKKDTDAADSIFLYINEKKEVHLNIEAFSKMKRIRLLKIDNVIVPRGLNCLSEMLLYMELHGYPFKSLPTSWKPDKLVELIMHRSGIEQLKKDFLGSDKLKVIDLSYSKDFITTPDFTGFPNLEKLILQGCTRLSKVHPSIAAHQKLIILNLKDCESLNSLPHEINLESLETFVLSGCSKLMKFPEIGRNMTRLRELNLDGTAIEELPLSFKHLAGLILLNLQDCKNLLSFPSIICSVTSLRSLNLSGCKGQPPKQWNFILPLKHSEPMSTSLLLPKSISGLSSLISLELSDCNLPDEAIPDDLSCLSSLLFLNLSKNNFTCLPDSISQLSKLKFICLDNCSRLQSLPKIPLSTELVMARECTLLENYSNQVAVWTSGETGFTFIDCLGIPEDEISNLSSMLPPLDNIHLHPLWQTYMEEQIRQDKEFHIVCFQTRIPEWFRDQRNGNFVTIQRRPGSWRGIVLCAVFEISEHEKSDSENLNKYSVEFKCHLDIDIDCPLVFNANKEKFKAGLFEIWVYIPHASIRGLLDGRSRITPKITTNSPGVEIKRCGARILYEQDIVDFVENLRHSIFNDICQHHESFGDQMNHSGSHRKRRYMEEKINRKEGFHIICPQTGIPEWFRNQTNGHFVQIQLRPDSWRGIAVCAIFEKSDSENLDKVSPDQDSEYFHEFKCRLDMDERCVEFHLVFEVSKDKFKAGTFGILMYMPHALMGGFLDGSSCITPSITSNNPGVEIKMCGAHVLYYQDDMVEFVTKLSHASFDDIRQCDESFKVYHMNHSESNHVDEGEPSEQTIFESDSNSILKKVIMSLLSKLYQADSARYHWFDYIFPHDKIPNWFTRQNLGTMIGMELPKNLHDNTSWMGLAICASYSVLKSVASFGDNRDSAVFVNFSSLSGGDKLPFGPYIGFPLSRDVYDESDRILVFYIPRLLCQSNQCTQIWASFGSNNSAVDLDMCGIRLVYEQDLEGFVQAIGECMLRLPEVYFSSCYLNLLDQVKMFDCCDHGKDFGCAFSTMPKLLPGIENVAKAGRASVKIEEIAEGTSSTPQIEEIAEGTSSTPQTEEIAEGTSKYSSSSSISLGIPLNPRGCTRSTRRLKSWFKTYLQDLYDKHGIFNHCFPQREIPKWFNQGKGPLIKLQLMPCVNKMPDWMGFAFCAVYSFHKHPFAVSENLDSKIPHRFMCHMETNVGSKVLEHIMNEDEVLISLNQRAFIWVSFIPCEVLPLIRSQCEWVTFSFLTDTPDLSPEACGVNFVFKDNNMEEFTEAIVQCLISHIDYMDAVRSTCDKVILKKLPLYSNIMSGIDSSYEDQGPQPERIPTQNLPIYDGDNSGIRYSYTPEHKTGPTDFHPSKLYNFVFLPNKIRDWFRHQSGGYSVTMDIPPNNCIGLVLCASFSFQGHPEALLDIFASEIPHYLYCQIEISIAGMHFSHTLTCYTSKEEIMWLLNLGEFIWISYVPFEFLINHVDISKWNNVDCCCRIEASFVSEWPGMRVENCGLRLLYQHEQVEFQQKLKHCDTLISEYRDSIHQYMDHYKERNMQNRDNPKEMRRSVCDNGNLQLDVIVKTHRRTNLLEFDPCTVHNYCFPPRDILDWFSHQSNDQHTVAMQLQPSFHSDTEWMGLVLCAFFSVNEHHTDIDPSSEISHHLICHLETDVASPEPVVYRTGEEEFMLLDIEDGFIWLSYIPRGSFPDWLNQSSRIEASFVSDWPGLTVHKCGLRLFYMHDELEFEQIICRCNLVSDYETSIGHREKRENQNHDDHEVRPRPSSTSEDSHSEQEETKNLQEFDRFSKYNYCFPLNDLINWFSNIGSSDDSKTILLPPNLHNESNWMGLSLCACFEINGHSLAASATPDNLDLQVKCHLKTDIGSVEHLHVYSLTKREAKLLKPIGFIWISYIPGESLPNGLNRCSHLEASIESDCPSLTVKKWALRLLFLHHEEGFKETIAHCKSSFSNNWGFVQIRREIENSHPERRSMLKDKGKRVVE